MRVAVGSENPVKVAAVERAVADRFGATVESVAVASGVADQPRGHAETMAGARTRARRARSSTGEALGVGIEGGVAEHEGVSGLFLIMWAAVTDGDRMGVGAGPSLALPDRVADRVRGGEELGPALDDLLGSDGVGSGRGAAGVFTDGVVDRESSLVHAVAGAMGPFVTDLY